MLKALRRARDADWKEPQELHAVLFENVNVIEDYLLYL